MISAVAALGILYLTATGLKAAKPIFENAALREENAQLPAGYGEERRAAEPGEAGGRRTGHRELALCLPAFLDQGIGGRRARLRLERAQIRRDRQPEAEFPILRLQTGAELLRRPPSATSWDCCPRRTESASSR